MCEKYFLSEYLNFLEEDINKNTNNLIELSQKDFLLIEEMLSDVIIEDGFEIPKDFSLDN